MLTLFKGHNDFINHCETCCKKNRVLIIETTLSHQETLPTLIYCFNTLGYHTDILLRNEHRPHREIYPSLPTSVNATFFYSLSNDNFKIIASKINSHPYEYIYINTLFEYWINDELKYFPKEISTVGRKIFATVHHYEKANSSNIPHHVKSENLFVLGEHMEKRYNIFSLIPSYFYHKAVDFDHFQYPINFITVGGIDEKRRSYDQLIDSCIALNDAGLSDKYRINIYGSPYSSSSGGVENFYNLFVGNLSRYSIESNIVIHHNPPFEQIYKALQINPYYLFLMDSKGDKSYDYFKNKITGAMNLVLGFSCIPILDRRYATLWGFTDFSLNYDDTEGLIKVMKNIISDPVSYLHLKEITKKKNEEILKQNLTNLSQKMKN